jgi:hypothetical protein
MRKKNQPIWSSYEGERVVTIFNPREKEKLVLLHEHVTNCNELIDFSFFLGLKLVTSHSPSYELEMR